MTVDYDRAHALGLIGPANVTPEKRTAHPDAIHGAAILAHLNTNVVGQVDQLEHGLQVVIAVRPPPQDVQEQVQLGRRGPQGDCHGVCQLSMINRTRTVPRSRVNFCGSGPSAVCM